MASHREKSAKCDLTVDGERFDITNLLAELPTEITGSASNNSNSAEAAAFQQGPRRTSKLAKLEKKSSHYFPRLSLYEGNQDEDEANDGGNMSFMWGDLQHHPKRQSNHSSRKSHRSSSLSSLSMSFHIPGLTDLGESLSSFTGDGDPYVEDDLVDQCQEIQVGPGVYLPFRGRHETWQAIQEGRAVSTHCLECAIELVVARDCKHVICPECHTLNPISMKDYSLAEDGETMQILSPRDSIHFGVLMGFKAEWCGEYYDQVQQLNKK